jgi:hypothetical protein
MMRHIHPGHGNRCRRIFMIISGSERFSLSRGDEELGSWGVEELRS